MSHSLHQADFRSPITPIMDGPSPQEEDFSSMPIADRLAHKNWKARVSAYESLVKTFQNTASDTDPAFKPYTNNPDLLKKIVTDSNAVAQEKGVECLVAYVKFAGETAAKTREAVVPALVDKCYGSSRAGTKAHALELTLQYIEVENGGTGVVGDILPGLSAKQPKAVAGCATVLKEITRRALPKIFAHSDKTVRAEGTILTHTLYQYIGPGIETWLADLKPVQVKELKEAFENMEKEGKGKGTLKPERLTRAQAREAEMAPENDGDAAEAADGAEDGEDAANLDPRAFAEPEDIVSKLPSSLSTALTSSKWKERKEVLDELQAVLNSTPRIKDAPELGDLVKSLATRIQTDANINCVMTAATCLEALAKGMMASFARFREAIVPPMLERLKERKATVTDTIGAALDAVFLTTTLPDIIPDLSPALAHKNPQVKEGTLKFLSRCLSTSKTPIHPPQIKPLAESLASLLEDGLEGCRNEAATCLGTLMKMVGERPLNAIIEPLAEVRKAKIKEASEKASVKCKAGGAAPPKAAAPPAAKKPVAKAESKPPAKEDLLDEIEPPKKVAKPPARLLKSKAAAPPGPSTAPPSAPAPKKPPPVTNAKGNKPTAPAAPGALDTFKYKHTPEDAEVLAAELIPTSVLADLGDANWKTRLAALDELSAWLEALIAEVDAEVIIRSLAKKGWAEKNFQVSAKIYGICVMLAERCLTFSRSCVAICVPHMVEKLGDMKLKKPAGDALLIFGEKASLQFVLNQCQLSILDPKFKANFNSAYEPLYKQKAPKVLADAIAWINSALTEFGIAGLSLRSLIDFLKMALQNSNATVRTSATKTLVTVKLFAGSGIKDLLEDLNPQLLNTITTEFDKVEGTAPPEPARVSADVATAPTTSSQNSGGGGDALDDLFPRVEIDGLLKGTTILADAKSDAWKTKKEALETLQNILDQGSNKRLKPNMGELAQVLKARVVDTNKAVQSLALDIVARIATGMGKPFEKQNRFFVLPVATVLADQKAPIRNAALCTLTAIATACEGLDSMIAGITSGLETANPLQKGTLMHWISEWFSTHEYAPGLDLSTWAGPIVASLDDRNGDVRKGAQTLLPILITSAGYDYVIAQTNSLKPASRNSATPFIQAARSAAAIHEPAAAPLSKVKAVAPSPRSQAPSPRPDSPADLPDGPPAKQSGIKATGVRRKLPLGSTRRPESRSETPVEAGASKVAKPPASGLKRPGASSLSVVKSSGGSVAPVSSSLPFFSSNLEARKGRCSRDPNRWINESGPTRKDLADLLYSQMEPHASKEVLSRLFSHDHNAMSDHIVGIGMLCDLYNSSQGADEASENVCLANFDLPLKYASIKAHEPQPNLISKCLELAEAVLAFLRSINYQLTDNEALCFIPTIIFKLGDAREQVRVRVQNIIQSLPKVYAYSHVFQLLLDYGLKSKVAKTRQYGLDELATLLKKSGISACDPSKAFPVIASMISDKDSSVRKSALAVLRYVSSMRNRRFTDHRTHSEGYSIVGEKVWTYVGNLLPKDRTQLEERLRRVAGPSTHDKPSTVTAPQISRIAGSGLPRPGSPAFTSRIGGIPRPESPAVGASRLVRPSSPTRAASPTQSARATSPSRSSKFPPTSHLPGPSHLPAPMSPPPASRKSALPSRLGRPKTHIFQPSGSNLISEEENVALDSNGAEDDPSPATPPGPEDITLTISSILSSDPSRSVDALKKIQKILGVGAEGGSSSPQYRELAEHTEGLIETITLQMAHIFERPEDIASDENFRLAKHLIQTLNNFCDHPLLAESLTVGILTSLLEELTLRLLETDDSPIKQVKDLSRFINMIILRLFATGRRMSIFRALFALLLQIVKPFSSNRTPTDSQEAKVAELVLKCVWKLARSIPQDLNDRKLDPVELFPAIEHFLQSVPPNDWRARAANKVPCGDMPLRTIKVIIQHVVAHYGDDVYDLLSASFDDPSATIVYPYVYRILNSNLSQTTPGQPQNGHDELERRSRPVSTTSSRPMSPQTTSSQRSPSRRESPVSLNGNGSAPLSEEPDPDAQLLVIIGHISSETTGALHKEGITELHQFLKAYPHKRPRVEKMLESTGAAFRKYINRALATRAAEDQERGVAVAHTLSRLESNQHEPPSSPVRTDSAPQSPRRLVMTRRKGLGLLWAIMRNDRSTASLGSDSGSSRLKGPGQRAEYNTIPRVLAAMAAPPKNDNSSHLTYETSILFWKLVVNIFFREIRPRGAFNIPRHGPFLDPLLLSLQVHKETHRHVQFLAAAKSMERRFIGFFSRLMESIPVARAADGAKPGTGRVYLSEDDPCLVIGEGTRFMTEFSPRMQILLPKTVNHAIAEVAEVISDTRLRIKKEFGGDNGKRTARVKEKITELRRDGQAGLEFKILPFIDQQQMYRYVYESLKRGGSIGIFPEGGSHDRTDLLPLKAGVSIMALGAMANDPDCHVKIVPVGFSYFHPHRFRSRAVIEFGSALDVPAEFVDMYKQGGTQKREAVSKFLDLIYDGLKTVTLIQAVRRLYKTPAQHLTLSQVVELNRRLLEGYTHFKDEPRIKKLRQDVLKYNRLLRDLGLRDHQSIAEALAASTVKLKGRDVLATWKVLISLGVAPVLYLFYAFLATLVATRAHAPWRWRIMSPIILFMALPLMNLASLKFGEAGMDVLKSLRPLIVALVPGQQRSLDNLRAMREQLSNEVAAVINDFGPKLYDDFNQWRMLPSASAPPSSGTPGLWRRKSSTGAVDAQGLGLIHPMTWIDERLFGWSRSATRGTSAWAGMSFEEPGHADTPEDSDEDEAGDYEGIIGLVPVHDEQGGNVRSRNNSYANLQRLRLSNLAQTSALDPHFPDENDGLHMRTGHRNRKESLFDGVSVQRLATLDRQEPFPEATNDINEELRRVKNGQVHT
ncbi:hypothetical protein D9757_001918 [Collybiopsis confluens]|uniref:Microtubule associated protein n=1 Tax=Collybiopsis confluens TaxID=2823264 RepID=A0A8H5HYC7_9AGAR|nr:hypothetical protein D9757_001918 [Collybiopsis confluens]